MEIYLVNLQMNISLTSRRKNNMYSHNFHTVDEKNRIYENDESFQVQLLPSFCFPLTTL